MLSLINKSKRLLQGGAYSEECTPPLAEKISCHIGRVIGPWINNMAILDMNGHVQNHPKAIKEEYKTERPLDETTQLKKVGGVPLS